MKVTLTASTGAKILVWREGDTFHAQQAQAAAEPQICLGIDLFEVIADLAGLDLEKGARAAEAIRLSELAQRRLGSLPPGSAASDRRPRSNGS
jgi:hypothetical protein